MRQHIPNLLSALRILAAPVLIAIALQGHFQLYLLLLALSQFTDFLDGYLARRLNAQSALGARLDILGDACNYAVGITGVCVFFPAMIEGVRAGFLILVVVLYLARFGLARWRAGEWIRPVPLRLAKPNYYVQCVLIIAIAWSTDTAPWVFPLAYTAALAETVEYLWRLRRRAN